MALGSHLGGFFLVRVLVTRPHDQRRNLGRCPDGVQTDHRDTPATCFGGAVLRGSQRITSAFSSTWSRSATRASSAVSLIFVVTDYSW